MNPVGESQFRKLLDASGLTVADAALGIGRELTYIDAVGRAVILHFAKRDPQSYVRDATTRILELASEWLVVPRYGPVLDLGLLDSPAQLAAVSFGAPERGHLADYLPSRLLKFDVLSENFAS
jgi:hypothetical protein